MALTRITKGVIKPNENYDTHNINSTGIVTATRFDGPFTNLNVSGVTTFTGDANFGGNVSIAGTLTYEDVTNIDSVGIITAQSDIHVGGGVSAVGVGTFGSLDISGDIDVDGHTNLDNISVAGVSTFSGNVTVDAGANTTLDVVADSAGVAMVRTTGASGDQTTAAFELRQSTSSIQGGGISYNGDGSPSFVSGETADNVTFYRILNGTRSEVFSYPYNSDTVTFNSTVIAPLFQGNLTGTVNTAAQPNITSLGTLSSLTVSGAGSPISFTHTGGNCVTFNRNSKQLAINANYAGNDAYANIVMSSGMDIRWSLGGGDRIVFKSDGHIEPQNDSQINLGANLKRFANVYADTLYGDGSNLTGITQTTINNNANNKIITGSGTANTLEAESTFTYNGTHIAKIDTNQTYAMLQLDGSSSGGGAIEFYADGTRKFELYGIDAGIEIYDREKGAYHSKFLSGGNVEISDGKLLIGDSNTNNAFSGGDDLVIGNTSSNTRSGITVVSHSDKDGGLYFSKGTGSDAVRGQFVYQHDVNGGYMRFYTDSDERLRISSDGRVGVGLFTNLLYQLELKTNSTNLLRINNSGENAHGSHDAYIVAGGTYYQNPVIGGSIIKFNTFNGSAFGERARITSGGEVLIGGIRTANTGFGNKVLISGGTLGLDGNGSNIGMHFHRNAGDTEGYIGIGPWAVTGGTDNDFGFAAKGDLLFGTSSSTWAQKMRVADNGRVKIGTGAPKAQLDIKQQGNGWEDAILIQHNSANTGWNIHAETTNSALWFGYNSNTAASLTDQGASQVLHLNSNRTISTVTSQTTYEFTIGGISGGPTLWLRDSGTTGTPRILFGSTAGALIGAIAYNNPNDYMAFSTNGVEHIRIDSSGHFKPVSDATRDLGTSASRWRNVYTTDLQLSNENTGGNEVDGTEGNWTLQEGESDVYMINRKTGKKYKMMLQEVN